MNGGNPGSVGLPVPAMDANPAGVAAPAALQMPVTQQQQQQQKRAFPASAADERASKQLKAEAATSVNGNGAAMGIHAQTGAMAATQPMANAADTGAGFTGTSAAMQVPGERQNLYFMGSTGLPQGYNQAVPQLAMGAPTAIQQRQQPQQHYLEAMAAAQRNAATTGTPTPNPVQQQQQRQAAMVAAIMAHQKASATAPTPTSSAAPPPAMNAPQRTHQAPANPARSVHVASLMASEPEPTPTGASQATQQTLAPTSSSVTGNAENPETGTGTCSEVEEPCLICHKKGDIFSCNGGCGLHVHPACIGEDALFPFIVGQLCGSCYIMQQNRATTEDLTKGGTNALSIRRAVLCLNMETNSQINFHKFGHLASLRLGEIGTITGYPIKPFAEKFVEPYLQRWMREKLVSSSKWVLNVREVFTVMIGLYSLKRACIAHGMLESVIEIVKSRKFSVTDFLGWHPAIESPNVRCSSLCAICGIRNSPDLNACARCHHKLVFPSTFTKYISSLLAAFYAEEVGLPLGTSALDVFAHTNTVRSMYKGLRPVDSDGVAWDLFADQMRMIFGLLEIMSNFGTLQLDEKLFAPEVRIIFNSAYVNQAMLISEFEVVGKFLQCMKLFGHQKSTENFGLITACERFLLFKQLPNGSWNKFGGTTVDQYKATVACSKGLAVPNFRGYGPLSNNFQRLLEKWARATTPTPLAAASGGRKAAANGTEEITLPCGATVKPSTRASFKRLEAMYRRQTAPAGGSTTLEALMAVRMKKLLQAKAKSEAESQPEPEVKKDASKEEPAVKQEASATEATKTDVTKDASIKAEPAKDETPTGGATDSEDVKVEQEAMVHGTAISGLPMPAPGEEKMQEVDDEALTTMSLHDDLTLFDGLKFEDGGIIDMSLQPLGDMHGEDEDEDDAEDDAAAGDAEGDADVDGDGDGTDAPGQEDEEDEEEVMDNMYDDDSDEGDDANEVHHHNAHPGFSTGDLDM